MAKIDAANQRLFDAVVMSEGDNIKDVLQAIDAGADDFEFGGCRDKMPHEMTLLCHAAQEKKIETCKALINAGANIHAKDKFDKWEALKFAIMARSPVIVKLLLDAGADIYAKGSGGMTALQFAECLRPCASQDISEQTSDVIDLLRLAKNAR